VNPLAARLAAAGCVAADEEAAELRDAAAGDTARLEAMVVRRESGEPLAWIVGSIDFGGVRVAVTPGVYVPRLQTLPLAQRAAALLPPAGVAVDVCTGSGALATYLSARHRRARVVGTDADGRAVDCARSNHVEAYEGDLFDPVPAELRGGVDVVIAVAPYVPAGDLRFLPRDVRDYEPEAALLGGVDGVAVIGRIVGSSPQWLRPGGWLLLELGAGQAAPVTALLDAAGFTDSDTLVDDEGDERGVSARRP
jgi:release factor glutamine methyltransferase